MATYGIVCEYNPFHNGHKYQIDSLKPDTVVCVMSSNVVQRGSFAVCDKYSRAEAAVRCGADLVLELPFPFSMLSAEYFASSAIYILGQLGFIDFLSFGCESDDYCKLKAVAEFLLDEDFNNKISALIKGKPFVPFAHAREMVVNEALGQEYSAILGQPNNILAIEYIKALIKSSYNIIPKPLKRKNCNYHDIVTNGEFCSANGLRKMLEENKSIENYVPEEANSVYKKLISCGKMPVDQSKLEISLLAFLRTVSCEKLKSFYDLSPLAQIIKSSASKATTLDQLYDMCAVKNFTRSRVRRCILAAYLGVTKEIASQKPLYTSVLALNSKGAELLSKVRKSCELQIITKPSSIKNCSDEIYLQYMAGIAADDVYSLLYPVASKAGETFKKTPYVIK